MAQKETSHISVASYSAWRHWQASGLLRPINQNLPACRRIPISLPRGVLPNAGSQRR